MKRGTPPTKAGLCKVGSETMLLSSPNSSSSLQSTDLPAGVNVLTCQWSQAVPFLPTPEQVNGTEERKELGPRDRPQLLLS